ncbi:unnamed protein product [Toxocara canis]|uniref:Ovule protein n=1 Tax=Toxocara canis TaxID=6265 RepID=A0A183UQ31_TOXCA|nr:unnamed protein product [Toxocara canis]
MVMKKVRHGNSFAWKSLNIFHSRPTLSHFALTLNAHIASNVEIECENRSTVSPTTLAEIPYRLHSVATFRADTV